MINQWLDGSWLLCIDEMVTNIRIYNMVNDILGDEVH